MMEVSKNTLVAYEKDERCPGADFLNKLLQLFPEINPTWLLTGEGEMKRNDAVLAADYGFLYGADKPVTRKQVPQLLDEELLQAILEAVEDYLDGVKGHLSATKKAQLITMLYEMSCDEAGRKIDKATVIRLVKIAI